MLLGVLTAESNLQQASQHVIQGQTSNPLTSFNWTDGETDNTGLISWPNSDCGYGIGQITSGMCLAPGQNGADQCENQGTAVNPGMTTEQQLAVAVDYQANIAAAAQMLVNEWNTQLVTVTIGGNDIGFASVLADCLANPTTTCITKYDSDDDNNLYTAIDNLKPNLIAAYQAMQQKAPDAKIFQPGTTCSGILNLPVPDVDFLNDLGLYLDNTIVDAAKAAGIYSMDERYAFLGHQICSFDLWVYQLPTGFTAGTAVLDSSAWFHPTAEGHGQIASDLAVYWQALQSVQPETTKGAASKTAKAVSQVTPAASAGWVPLNLPDGIPTTPEATEMLEDLTRTSTQLSGYNMNASYWNFTTTNGCDTRQDVLRAQAVSPMARFRSAR